MKARKAPAAIPLATKGKVTRRKVVNSPAPRLREASRNPGSSCDIAATVVRNTNGTQTIVCPSTRNPRLGRNPAWLMNISAAKPKASAGNRRGDIKSTSQTRSHDWRPRDSAIDAAVPRTTQTSVVQNATTRLFHAARCIWSASSSATYQRSE